MTAQAAVRYWTVPQQVPLEEKPQTGYRMRVAHHEMVRVAVAHRLKHE